MRPGQLDVSGDIKRVSFFFSFFFGRNETKERERESCVFVEFSLLIFDW
jgi:hypothetical protein